MNISLLGKVCLLSSITCLMNAGEWNQHRGPFSNNLSDESINSANWLKSSNSVEWKVKDALGFSSFTTYKGNAYTLIAEEDEDGLMREICISLNLKTGKRVEYPSGNYGLQSGRWKFKRPTTKAVTAPGQLLRF